MAVHYGSQGSRNNSSSSSSRPSSSSNNRGVTFMSSNNRIQPSTFNGVANADSIQKADEANARIAANRARNIAMGNTFLNDRGGYGVSSSSNNSSSSTQPRDTVSIAESNNKKASEIYNANRKDGTPYMSETGIMTTEKPISTATNKTATNKSTDILSQFENGGLPEGYTFENGQLMVDGGKATPQQQLDALNYQFETSETERNAFIADRDAQNLLNDIMGIATRNTQYLQDSSDLAVSTLKQEKKDAEAKYQLQEEELQYNLQNDLNELAGKQEDTQSEYLNASIRAGGARFSTMATGQASIDTKFAELQQKTKAEAQFDLRSLGLQEDATSNYYSSKIADIRLNSQNAMADLTDKFMVNTRNILLGMSDNKVQMSKNLYKSNLDYQGKILAYNQAQLKLERDAITENFDLQLKGQRLANDTGKPVSLMLPDGSTQTWNPKPEKGKGKGTGTLSASESSDVLSSIIATSTSYEDAIDQIKDTYTGSKKTALLNQLREIKTGNAENLASTDPYELSKLMQSPFWTVMKDANKNAFEDISSAEIEDEDDEIDEDDNSSEYDRPYED